MKSVINTEKLPIKSWATQLDDNALEQAKNLANLPFAHSHIALMADAHLGVGMPVGGVLATDEVVVPNAVGVDIGCGMCFVETHIDAASTKRSSMKGVSCFEAIRRIIIEKVPTGFSRRDKPIPWEGFADAPWKPYIAEYMDSFQKSLGTLGGGNHFIELQENEKGRLCVMIHSGSRSLGKRICDYFNNIAVKLNKAWHSKVDSKHALAFLPTHTGAAHEYLNAVDFALAFAKENRQVMMQTVLDILYNLDAYQEYIPANGDTLYDVDVHHNYVAQERHYGQSVYVHRKGAIRAMKGDIGIIPGSQGTKSYIVRGLGNRESFMSCSHGAGRIYGRRVAKEVLNFREELKLMEGIAHGMSSKLHLDEAPSAYKDIGIVMKNQEDLVEVVSELAPLMSVKG